MDFQKLFDLKYYSWSQRSAIKGMMALFPMSYACLFLASESFVSADLASRLLLAAALDSVLVAISIFFVLVSNSIIKRRVRNILLFILVPCFITTVFFCTNIIFYDMNFHQAFYCSIPFFPITFACFLFIIWRISQKDGNTSSDSEGKESDVNPRQG